VLRSTTRSWLELWDLVERFASRATYELPGDDTRSIHRLCRLEGAGRRRAYKDKIASWPTALDSLHPEPSCASSHKPSGCRFEDVVLDHRPGTVATRARGHELHLNHPGDTVKIRSRCSRTPPARLTGVVRCSTRSADQDRRRQRRLPFCLPRHQARGESSRLMVTCKARIDPRRTTKFQVRGL